MKNHQNKRLYLLNALDKQDIYGLPIFTPTEREHFFLLNTQEHMVYNKLKFIHSKLHFILQLGYFKAKKRLFNFTCKDPQVMIDAQHVMTCYFKSMAVPDKLPSHNIISKNNAQILLLMQYQTVTSVEEKNIMYKIAELTRSLSKPSILLRELFIYLENYHLMIPRYSTLQRWISSGLKAEEKRLHTLIRRKLSKKISTLLDILLTSDEHGYQVTVLKQFPKNFNFKQIQQQITLHRDYYEIYRFSKEFLPLLDISHQSIEYYASLVDHYNAQALCRFTTEKKQLYLLCYAYHRFQKMNDQMIQTFLHYVDQYMSEAKVYAKQKIGEDNRSFNQDLSLAGPLLEWFIDGSLSTELFDQIQKKALLVMPKEKIASVVQYIKTQRQDPLQYEWEYHAKNYRSIIKNLRPIFQVLSLEARAEHNHLLKSANFIKKAYDKGISLNQIKTDEFPLDEISKRMKPYLLEDNEGSATATKKKNNTINPYKYEFFVYQQLKYNMEAIKIYSSDTTQYKSFDDDLGIQRSGEDILHILQDTRLHIPIETLLDEYEEIQESLITQVNKNIINGENKHIKIKEKDGKKTWRLPYVKKKDEIDNPFYDQLPPIHISALLDYVDDNCQFMKAFTHIKPFDSKSKVDKSCLKACLIANATSMGIYSMSESCDLSYDALRRAQSNYIRLETLKEASDIISEATASLPIFKHYYLEETIAHGSSDGQKYRTQHDTFNSRHSPKYYGLGKGVSPYTLVLNHIPINVKMIGAHEHESHHLYDVLFNTSAEINIDRVSTDTAGSNQVNFALLDARYVTYAPCYRSINNKTKWIGSFKEPHQYKDYLIQPTYKFDKKLIISEWPNVLPIFAALMKKETSQSVVIKKLSSNARKCKTKQALWEYNNILLSIYLLRYIDDPNLRCYVRAALNRGEAYHQLRRKIGEMNGKSFRGSGDLETEIWNECARLMANVIIYYNAHLLSQFMVIKEVEGDEVAAQFIRTLSPVASQHLIFKGRYEFCSIKSCIDIQQMLTVLEKALRKEINSKKNS